MTKPLDQQMRELILRFGAPDVLAALARETMAVGMPPLSRRLHLVYEWAVENAAPPAPEGGMTP